MNNTNTVEASRIFESLREIRPADRDSLRDYLQVYLDINVPAVSLCEEHCSPMDYLWHVYNADSAGVANGDVAVWANRGGGKTHLAAVATLLDCMFKDGCSVRILGGSLEQSHRMYEYLAGFMDRGFDRFLDGKFGKGSCRFVNGSSVEVMPQSDRNVRGRHINKLRCDEAELFDAQVLAAARFITHSTGDIVGAMETASTMHRPYGLMQRIIADAQRNDTPIFKWCMFETIERCRDHNCSRCPLWGDCRGRAKMADGYLRIDDCITQMKRSSRSGFESEMLCIRPSLDNAVFADFDESVHVASVDYDENLPLYRAMDFGYVNPFVCLWIQLDCDGVVYVIDEYVRSRATIDTHARVVKERTPCDEERVAGTFCDPAGAATGDITGTSPVAELAAAGIRTRYARSGILEGIELIRRTLRAGDGSSKLVIDPRCARLIEAMQCYHYPDNSADEKPEKDGVYDHPIDALRYFFVNVKNNNKDRQQRY